MKIALITDQHFGARNDSEVFHKHFEQFYGSVFFPYIDKHNIKHIVDLGDTFDRRKYVNYFSLDRCRGYWFNEVAAREIRHDVIVGNHCTYYKNTNKINSPDLLLKEYNNIIVHAGPRSIIVDGVEIALIPWICEDNVDETVRFINDTKAQVCFGHLELQGFEMYKGSMINIGYSASMFKKFDIVCSGHYHHKSTRDNINYLGAPYEMTWSDYDDPRGFHIFDTNTRSLEFIENPLLMFHKIYYDDVKNPIDIKTFNPQNLTGKFVKIVVSNKTNPHNFDLMVDIIEKKNVASLQVVDDHMNLNMEEDSDIINEAEDTLSLVSKYIQQLQVAVDKPRLEGVLRNLYHDAISLE